jgi:hypothetical protein
MERRARQERQEQQERAIERVHKAMLERAALKRLLKLDADLKRKPHKRQD